MIRAGSDYIRPKLSDPSGRLMDVVNYEPGTVLHMDANRQFIAGPVGTGTPGFIQAEQAVLRGCGARWRFPEYFSGNASNNNMASSIVAGSPYALATVAQVGHTQPDTCAFSPFRRSPTRRASRPLARFEEQELLRDRAAAELVIHRQGHGHPPASLEC